MTAIHSELEETEVFQQLRRIVAKMVGFGDTETRIRVDSNLFELGLDSMNVVDLLLGIEEHFKLELGVEGLSGDIFENFGRLVQFVESRVDGR